jgi:hypothetical protein
MPRTVLVMDDVTTTKANCFLVTKEREVTLFSTESLGTRADPFKSSERFFKMKSFYSCNFGQHF